MTQEAKTDRPSLEKHTGPHGKQGIRPNKSRQDRHLMGANSSYPMKEGQPHESETEERNKSFKF